MSWLSGFLMSPALAVFGLLAISAPIVIHLLNRRRFRVVDWAAMEFLLDADRKNRRRVRLENLLILLLRCLAILLLGLLLARPFVKSSVTGGLVDASQFERVFLLDDSLSMQAQGATQSSMESAKQVLVDVARSLVDNQTGDMLTVLLTSQPDTPLLSSQIVREDTLVEIVAEIEKIQASDTTANLASALLAVERHLAALERSVSRVVYLATDLRQQDWRLDESDKQSENHPTDLLERLARQTVGCYLVDVGSDQVANLIVSQMQPEETLIAGVASPLNVTVANHGEVAVDDVQVKLLIGNSIPQHQQISSIAPGESETVQFNFFHGPQELLEENPAADHHASQAVPVTAQAVADHPTDQDRLLADSQRFYAARVIRGIPVLLVDGDPSADPARSEVTYLRHAVAPPGEVRFGVVADVVTDTELDHVRLSDYRVVFLCNVYRLAPQRVKSLERWTRDGGGLVIMPGDQVDEDAFNEQLFRQGQGLSPIGLQGLRGDETRQDWVQLELREKTHPIFYAFAVDPGFTQRVKIFRWWGSRVRQASPSTATVLARLSDPFDVPAIVQQPFGEGQVLALNLPADADWTNWPPDPTYAITMYMVVRYLAGDPGENAQLRVGQPLRHTLDLVTHRASAMIQTPDDQRVNVQATLVAGRSNEPTEAAERRIELTDCNRRGFYQLQLTRTDGQFEEALYAANVDPREGRLQALSEDARGRLTSEKVKIISGPEAAALTLRASSTEVWQMVLLLAVLVLCSEQLLGWCFGQRR